jgi:hypothetical protein
MSKVLHLTLKKKWFDMILSGEKKEEYRDIKLFWCNRFFKPDTSINYEDYYPDEMVEEFKRFPLDFNINLKFFSAVPVKFNIIQFRNGYSKTARTITVEFKGIEIGNAKPEWSDNWQGNVFIIKLGKILTTQTFTQK